MGSTLLRFAEENKLALIIFFLAALLRLVQLTSLPPSLNWDEVSHGYNAYSILGSAKDEWGEAFPTIFRAYGDYKLPVYIYVTAVSEAIFGLSSLAVRLPSALAGIATVVFTYLLIKKLFDQKSALLASILVAVEPWSLFLSRGAFEANFALALIVSAVYFFVIGVVKPRNLVISAALLGLTVWTYNSARVFVPVFLVALSLIYRKELKALWTKGRRFISFGLTIATLFLLPMFWQLANPVGQARYGKVAIINDGAIAFIEESRNKSTLPEPLKRVVYNRVSYTAQKFLKNWTSHFSAEFLFVGGGTNFQFSVPGRGVLYPLNGIFLIIGLILLARLRSKPSQLVISWFFLGPVASSLTSESPHVLRAVTILPMPMVITAFGLVASLGWLKGKLKFLKPAYIYLVYFALLVLSVKSYLNVYSGDYKRSYSWSWQYGYREAVEYVKTNYAKYEKILVSKKYGEPHEFFLFFWPWEPESYRQDPNLIRFEQSGWYWVDRFDKFYFVNDWNVPKSGQEFILESGGAVDCSGVSCLLVTSPGNFPSGWSKLETINFLDGKSAFEIYTNQNP
jgi:4-amino-4-deoxy-L-arabinose transferase-like glycosyltransferase